MPMVTIKFHGIEVIGGSGVIFAYEVEMKFPVEGVLTLFME